MSLPVISISDELGQEIMQHANQDLTFWQNQLDTGQPQLGFEFPDLQISAKVDVVQKRGQGRNVIGRLQVGEQPAEQSVMVGAHIDHLGRGAFGTLARDENEKGLIHVGADDNASGVAALLEIAQQIAHAHRHQKLGARRDLLIAAWSGEELGLHGSRHYVKENVIVQENTVQENTVQENGELANSASPSDSGEASEENKTRPPLIAYLNMDMVGRFDKKLVLQGIGSSNHWTGLIERRNLATDIPLQLSQDTNLPTDATEFYQARVPILAAFTGSHQDYHTPRDTPEKLDYEMAAKIAKLMGLITRSLLTDEKIPDYVEHTDERPQIRVSLRAALGTSPDYTEEVEGVLLKSIRKNSPADKAGVQGGDIVIELAGKKIENVYDYTYAIGALKVGEEVTIVIRRDGERLELGIVPESSQ